MRPLHPCSVSTCPRLTDKARCPEHTVTREERNPHSEESRKFYDSTLWKKRRAIVRRNQPICMICHRKPSRSVDHINGDRDDNRPENFQALCKDCHDEKSGREHQQKRNSEAIWLNAEALRLNTPSRFKKNGRKGS